MRFHPADFLPASTSDRLQLALVCITAVYVIVATLQWWTMIRQSKIIAGQLSMLNVSERPYIRLKDTNGRLADVGQHSVVETVFENAGRTPARDVVIESHVAIRDAPLPDDHEPPALSTRPSRNFMPAGTTTRQVVRASRPMQQEQLDGIMSGRLLFMVYGRATYLDGLGRSYRMRFCSQFMREFGGLATCPNYNDAD